MAKKKKEETIKIQISKESLFTRNEQDFLFTEVDGEAVMMNTESGTYWGLNATTTEIWNMLEQPKSTESIIESLLKIYDVDEDTCKKETFTVLAGMLKINILRLNDSKV